MNLTLNDIAQYFKLEPHPEGGFFKESYRSLGETPTDHGTRNHSTAIYFLLTAGTKSRLHRIKSDEVWHFYLGGPMTIVQISPEGNLETIILGQDILRGEKLQHVVPTGYWFGGFPNPGTDFSFVGCTVSPGFDFKDFELADRNDLLQQYPQHLSLIQFLT